MQHISPRLRTYAIHLGLAVGALSGLAVLCLGANTAWADALCTPPANGPTSPDAPTFTYQCDGAYAGDWTNAYYVYNPATAAESPLYTEAYTYNCTAGAWSQNEWDYDPTSGAYVENWMPATTAPNQPTNCATNNSSLNTSTDASTTSGDATVAGNGTAGNATSGSGTVEVTDTNTVDSTTSGGVTIFNANVGDTNGDLVLDPSQILPGTTGATTQPPAVVSATSDTSLSNTITATAASGNAVVTGNGDAGNATSGNAQVIINLINMLNSAITAGQSFIGTINIYGDLNGNILIPQSVIDQLLATGDASGGSPSLLSTTNESIVNNVNASAASGNATVADNAFGYGTATTGNANTNVTILNLTNSSVVGQNVLLVFVNVLGQWIGMIVNAPAGATSAEFGGGVISTTPSTGASTVDANTTLSITNTVNGSAVSGDASVLSNRNGGNATTGSAEVAVNILNIENSELSLANWFGVLFINVFGTWNGNFGILPTPVSAVPAGGTTNNDSSAPVDQTTSVAGFHQFATFVADGFSNPSGSDSAVLADTITKPTDKLANLPTPDNKAHASYALPFLGFGMALLLIAIAERDRILHHLKRN